MLIVNCLQRSDRGGASNHRLYRPNQLERGLGCDLFQSAIEHPKAAAIHRCRCLRGLSGVTYDTTRSEHRIDEPIADLGDSLMCPLAGKAH